MSLKDINKSTGFPPLGPLSSLAPVAAFSMEQIENLLHTKGILAFHIRHAIDPDKATVTAGLNVSNAGKERGHIYYDIRPLRVVPQDFSVRDTLTVMGMYTTGTVMMNVDGKYLDDSKERVFLRPNDLILLNPTITELYEETFEYKPEDRTKLHYRIVDVDFLAVGDWQGRNGVRFDKDVDFEITSDGYLKWIDGGNKPEYKNGKGQVVSIVYYYRPIFIVRAIPHSLRLLPSNKAGSGAAPRELRYAPQLCLLDFSVIRDGPENTTDWFNIPELENWEQWLEVK